MKWHRFFSISDTFPSRRSKLGSSPDKRRPQTPLYGGYFTLLTLLLGTLIKKYHHTVHHMYRLLSHKAAVPHPLERDSPPPVDRRLSTFHTSECLVGRFTSCAGSTVCLKTTSATNWQCQQKLIWAPSDPLPLSHTLWHQLQLYAPHSL